jgi:pimeloyl-ACP methyl ester carboxylesterase
VTRANLGGFAERFLDVEGAELRYFVAGAGEPVILVHGLGGAAANWALVAPALAERCRVLVPDLPGHGGSSPLPVAFSTAAYADRVAALAAHEQMLPALFLGHSLGGLVVLRLALRRPDAVLGLVLAAAAGISTTRRLAQLTVELLVLARPARAVAPFRERIARSARLRALVFGYWGAADPAALSADATLAFLKGPGLHTDTAGAGRAMLRDDPRIDLARLGCPCLVLWGARDRWVPLADGLEYARRLDASLRMIPDCGHLLIGERPDACIAAVDELLDRIRDGDELPLEAESLR